MTFVIIVLVLVAVGLALWALTCTVCHAHTKKDIKLVLELMLKTISGEIIWSQDGDGYFSTSEGADAGYRVRKKCAFISGLSVGTEVGRPVYAIRRLRWFIKRSMK